MCWVKIRERRLCPLTAYFGVLIELYTTEDLITQIKMKLGSGGIRTHASEETGALNQRLRPLGHATRYGS